MRLAKLLLAVVFVVVAGCTSSASAGSSPRSVEPAPGISEQTAINAALASPLPDVGVLADWIFPGRSGPPIDCTIMRGGDYLMAGPMPATCTTSTFSNAAGGWTVRFTESWSARDFPGAFAADTAEQFHAWTFRVDRNGRATFIESRGAFPPQAAF